MPIRQYLAPLLLFLLVSLAVRPAVADNASDRARIIDDIEEELEEAEDSLDDVAGASSASPVSDAVRHVDNIPSLLDKLRDVKEDDSNANRIVDRYRDIIARFREAAGPLTRLKEGQPSLKDRPRVCTDLDKNLEERIAALIDKKDPKGTEELPRFAETLRGKADETWRDAENRKRDMEQWRDQTKRFDGGDGWSDVRSSMHRAADDVYRAWEADLKTLEQTCANLRKGPQHPKVEEALKQLAAFSQGREQIIKEAEGFLDAAARLLNGADQDTDDRDITDALAKAGDIESAVSKLSYAKGNDTRANEIVEKWPQHIAAYKTAVQQLRELKKWQFTLNNAVGKCQAQDEALNDFIGQFKDATGIVPIEQRASELQRSTRESLAKAREHGRQMEQWNADAQRLQLSDGKWTYVSGYVRGSAGATLDYWQKALNAAEKACADLASGTDHPKVQQAVKMLKGRIPPSAQHQSKHDSTCKGVPAGGFCMADDHCLDGKCSSNKCEQCPSRDDGRCHPPGTCSDSDYDSRRRDKEVACGKPFNSDAYKGSQKVDCRALGDLCNNAQACVRAREIVQQCFRGGDTRHMEELNTVRQSAERCEALLRDKRERNLCE